MAVLCVAQFVVVLDVTIVATALPVIGTDLGFTEVQLPAVLTAYTVVLAGLLIFGGRLADLAGARRMFRYGLLLFAVGSLACAFSWAPLVLIVARGIQGVGAALLSPAALAALSELVGPERRQWALGWWTAAAAGGGASGWVLGGVITEFVGWRWVFAVNVPIAMVTLALSGVLLASVSRWSGRNGSLDLPGTATVTVGIALAILGLSLVPGWRGWVVVGLAAVVLMWFVRIERRAAHPLIPAHVLRTPGVVGGNLTAAALTGSTTPAMLTVILYIQNTLDLSPARASVLFPAFNVAVIAGSLLAPRVLDRVSLRTGLVLGFAGVIAGTALLLTLPGDELRPITLLGSFSLMGLGLGIASVSSTTAGTVAVATGDRGVSAGLLNSTAQLGTALGLAITAPLIASVAPMTGYHLGYLAAALIALTGVLAATTHRYPST